MIRRNILTLAYSFLEPPPLNLATLQFSVTQYVATEGGEAPSACIELVSLTSQFIGTAIVSIMTEGPVRFREREPAALNLTTADVGEDIYCITPIIEADSIVQGNLVSFLTALAMPSLPTLERITFTFGRDRANYVVLDDDGME